MYLLIDENVSVRYCLVLESSQAVTKLFTVTVTENKTSVRYSYVLHQMLIDE